MERFQHDLQPYRDSDARRAELITDDVVHGALELVSQAHYKADTQGPRDICPANDLESISRRDTKDDTDKLENKLALIPGSAERNAAVKAAVLAGFSAKTKPIRMVPAHGQTHEGAVQELSSTLKDLQDRDRDSHSRRTAVCRRDSSLLMRRLSRPNVVNSCELSSNNISGGDVRKNHQSLAQTDSSIPNKPTRVDLGIDDALDVKVPRASYLMRLRNRERELYLESLKEDMQRSLERKHNLEEVYRLARREFLGEQPQPDGSERETRGAATPAQPAQPVTRQIVQPPQLPQLSDQPQDPAPSKRQQELARSSLDVRTPNPNLPAFKPVRTVTSLYLPRTKRATHTNGSPPKQKQVITAPLVERHLFDRVCGHGSATGHGHVGVSGRAGATRASPTLAPRAASPQRPYAESTSDAGGMLTPLESSPSPSPSDVNTLLQASQQILEKTRQAIRDSSLKLQNAR